MTIQRVKPGILSAGKTTIKDGKRWKEGIRETQRIKRELSICSNITYMCRDAQEVVTPQGTYCDIKYMCRDAQRSRDATWLVL